MNAVVFNRHVSNGQQWIPYANRGYWLREVMADKRFNFFEMISPSRQFKPFHLLLPPCRTSRRLLQCLEYQLFPSLCV